MFKANATLAKFNRYAAPYRRRLQAMWALALVALFTLSQNASAQVTLVDTGVDVPAIITALATAMGTIVLAVMLAWGGFQIVKKSIRWMRGIG
tara:strand:- start:1256 stop:1534 length:279 start_codon:yes stop_codon:yes gene_type:complete